MTSSRVQNIIERLLLGLAFAVIACHCLLATFQYVIPYRQFTRYEQWAAVVLLAFSFFYLIASLLISKDSRGRILNFLKRTLTFEQILLLLIFFCFLLSCYVNGKEFRDPYVYFGVHDWFIYDVFVCFFLLYPIAKVVGTEKVKKALEILIHIVVISYSIFTIVSLWHIFHLEVLTYPSGEQGGMTDGYALMLGRHYNLTGMIAITMLCLSIYMIFSQETFVRAIYTGFSIVHLVVVYLCNSRTVFVGFLAFVVSVSFCVTFYICKDKKTSVRLLLSIASALVLTILFWTGRNVTFALFEKITHFSELLSSETGEIVDKIHQYGFSWLVGKNNYSYSTLSTSGVSGARDLNSISNRFNIWRAAFRVMTSNYKIFFFGVTPYGVTEALQNIGGYWEEAAHAHNTILQVGVGVGVPAMGLYVMFLVSIAYRVCHLCFSGSAISSQYRIIVPSTILCFMIINLAEAYNIFYFSVMALFFYLLCGLLSIKKQDESVKRRRGWKKIIAYSLVFVITISSTIIVGFSFSGRLAADPTNLLLETNHGKYNFELDDNGYDATLKNEGNGVRVKIGNHPAKGWLVLKYNDDRSRQLLSKSVGDSYLLTFEAKTNTENALIKISHRNGDGTNNQIDFGSIYLKKAGEWINCFMDGSLLGVTADKQSLYIDLKNNVAGTEISIRNLKLQKSSENRDYENLLIGTNHGTSNFSLIEKGFSAILEREGEGVKVRANTHSDDGWFVLFFEDGSSSKILSGPEGTVYTISFDACSNVDNAEIQVSHRRTNGQDNQIDFGVAHLEKANIWQTISLTGTLEDMPANSQGVYLNLKYNPAGTEFKIKNLKLTKVVS